MNLYLINYTEDGENESYQILAASEYNALVRLGQMHGDDSDREGIEIDVQSVILTAWGLGK